MKFLITIEISNPVAEGQLVTPELLRSFAEDFRTNLLNLIPAVSVTIDTLP